MKKEITEKEIEEAIKILERQELVCCKCGTFTKKKNLDLILYRGILGNYCKKCQSGMEIISLKKWIKLHKSN